MALTGDPRRWSTEPGMPGVVHVLDPYHGMARGWDSAADALADLEEIVQLEGAHTIAAFFLETVSGTNGVLIPPDGYLQGVRDLCTKHGILMVCDEVMAGFGRTGEWFAVNHWNVVPDIMTMAKGLTSAYLPLGAVGMRRPIAEHFRDKVFQGGLTYNSHPMSCAAALATLSVYEEDDLVGNARRLGPVMTALLEDLAGRHPSVGAHRNIGLFGIVELARDPKTKTPLAPFGGTSDEMRRLSQLFREKGLYTFTRWHTFFTNPPLCITESELREGFAIVDAALTELERPLVEAGFKTVRSVRLQPDHGGFEPTSRQRAATLTARHRAGRSRDGSAGRSAGQASRSTVHIALAIRQTPFSFTMSNASMPQWLVLPSIQNWYGVHTTARLPRTWTIGSQ